MIPKEQATMVGSSLFFFMLFCDTKLAQFWHRFADDKSKGMWYNGIIQKWGSAEAALRKAYFRSAASVLIPAFLLVEDPHSVKGVKARKGERKE